MLAGPSRKPKYVESPRVPSDAIVSALRKVADNKESSHNGEFWYFTWDFGNFETKLESQSFVIPFPVCCLFVILKPVFVIPNPDLRVSSVTAWVNR